jgi:hypothetical protein
MSYFTPGTLKDLKKREAEMSSSKTTDIRDIKDVASRLFQRAQAGDARAAADYPLSMKVAAQIRMTHS